MSSKRRNKWIVVLMSIVLLGGSLLGLLMKDKEFSSDERRLLKQFPNMTVSSILSGKFMSEFEDYALDQFPMRESCRYLKSMVATHVFHHLDQRGIYASQGHLSKMEYPMNPQSIEKGAATFQKIYDRFLKDTDTHVYFSIIFDKNYYLAENSSVLAMNYEAFRQQMLEKTSFMTYIDIQAKLSLDDFYKSDLHWRQEKIVDVAEKLASTMGTDVTASYVLETLDTSFEGVYSSQSSLPHDKDQLSYLSLDEFEDCIVIDHQNNQRISVYDLEKATGRDPYEMFLSGSLSLITIENPNANTEKELILFRDSFSSSLAPLLIPGYAKITMVDIRYIQSDLLASWIDFDNQDVLFLYSTLVLNHGELLK